VQQFGPKHFNIRPIIMSKLTIMKFSLTVSMQPILVGFNGNFFYELQLSDEQVDSHEISP
jgi:hypothetical protein